MRFRETEVCSCSRRYERISGGDEKNAEKFTQHLEKMPDADRDVLEEYIEVLEQAHFKEEQRAYYQGIMDGVELLGGLGLIKKGSNMKKLVEKLKE